MQPTYELDKNALEPLDMLVGKLESEILDPRDGARPGAKVKFRQLLRADLVRQVLALHASYTPLVAVEERRSRNQVEIEKQRELRDRTRILVTQISHIIRAVAAEHPIVEEWIPPRIGESADERAANLADMMNRIVARRRDLAEKKIDLHLWPTHTEENVRRQLSLDEAARKKLEELEDKEDDTEKRRIELRKRVEALQPEINIALQAVFGSDRQLLVAHGYQERTSKARARRAAEKAAEQKAPGANPPAPGPVAQGTAAQPSAPVAPAPEPGSLAPAAVPEQAQRKTDP